MRVAQTGILASGSVVEEVPNRKWRSENTTVSKIAARAIWTQQRIAPSVYSHHTALFL